MTRRTQLQLLTRQATTVPGTVNLEKRTVDVVWSTGARVRQTNWWTNESWDEELGMQPGQVRMARLESGRAPMLDNHSRWGVGSMLAVVERAWLADGNGYATVRFSKRADVEPIWQDVRDGIIGSVSVGYRVYKYEDATPQGSVIGTVPVKRAVDWEPYEISLVAVPADIGAGVRAGAGEANECEWVGNDLERNMAIKKDGQESGSETVGKTDPVSTVEGNRLEGNRTAAPVATLDPVERERAITAERTRSAEIVKLTRKAKLDDTFSQRMIEENHPIEKVREFVIDAMADREPKNQSRHAEVTREADAGTSEAIKLALLNRFMPDKYTMPADSQARQFRGMTLLELGKESLEMHGVKFRGLAKAEVAGLALRAIAGSTSDFPNILANVAHKVLRDQYQEQDQTFRPFSRVVSMPDFKPLNMTQLGATTVLKRVTEAGEFKYAQVSDAKETMALLTYGEILSITRQTIINDDLQAFTRLPALMAAAAARMESDVVYAILTGNPLMGDGTALFAAGHNNVATQKLNPTTLDSTAGLDALYQLIRLQKGLASEFLNLTPYGIIVPPQLATYARKLLQSTTNPVVDAGTNPFKGNLVPIVEARLSVAATTWYMFANPGAIDIINVGYLDGEMGPSIETRIGFDIDGVEMKIREDFTAKAVDWRGLARSDGSTG